MQDEIAHRVGTDRGEQRTVEPQPMRANADVRGRAAYIRGKAGDVDERRANIVAVQVDTRSAHMEGVIRFSIHRYFTLATLKRLHVLTFQRVDRHARIATGVALFDPGILRVVA